MKNSTLFHVFILILINGHAYSQKFYRKFRTSVFQHDKYLGNIKSPVSIHYNFNQRQNSRVEKWMQRLIMLKRKENLNLWRHQTFIFKQVDVSTLCDILITSS